MTGTAPLQLRPLRAARDPRRRHGLRGAASCAALASSSAAAETGALGPLRLAVGVPSSRTRNCQTWLRFSKRRPGTGRSKKMLFRKGRHGREASGSVSSFCVVAPVYGPSTSLDLRPGEAPTGAGFGGVVVGPWAARCTQKVGRHARAHHSSGQRFSSSRSSLPRQLPCWPGTRLLPSVCAGFRGPRPRTSPFAAPHSLTRERSQWLPLRLPP